MSLLEQKKNIEVLLQLVKENPNLPIVPMVASECVCDDSYGYWMGVWSNAIKTKYWCRDEKMYDYDEYDELVENWIDDNYKDYENLSDNELLEIAKKKVNNYEWVDAIIIYINSF